MAPFQLIPEEGGEALRLPVCGAPLRNGALPSWRKVPLCGPASSQLAARRSWAYALCRLAGLSRLQQRVFLTGAPQVLPPVLHVHLQDLHGLEQLRRQLELLPEFGFKVTRLMSFSSLRPCRLTYLATLRAAVAWEIPSSRATATVVPQRR